MIKYKVQNNSQVNQALRGGINSHLSGTIQASKRPLTLAAKDRNVLEIEPDALLIFDAQNFHFDDMNQAALDLFEYSKEEIPQLDLYDLLHKKGTVKQTIHRLRADSSGSYKIPLLYFIKKDGSIFPGELCLTLYSSARRMKIIGVVRDVSERLLTEESLKILQERLEDLVKLRTIELAKTNEAMQLEIAQRKRAEKHLLKTQSALKRNLNFMETLLYAIPNPVFYTDLAGRFRGCNPAFEEQLGVKIAQIQGKKVEDVWPNEFARIYPLQENNAPKSIQKNVYHTKIRDALGNERDLVFSRGLYEDDRGQIAGLVGVFTDITTQKKIEEALRESKAMARVILNVPTDTAALLDNKGHILDINATMAEKYKKKVEQLIGKNIWELFPKEIADRRKKVFDHVIKSAEPFRYEEERDGIWYDTIVHPVKNNKGNISKIVFLARDITERKKQDKDLRIKDIALESSINAIAMLDFRNRVTYVNKAFLKLWELEDPSQIIKKSITKFFRSRIKVRQILNRLKQEGSWQGEVNATKKGGSPFVVRLSANQVYDHDHKPLCMLCSFIDITSQKKTEESLKRRLYFERIISNISSRFIGITAIDKAINLSLKEIGVFTKASRAYVFLLNQNDDLMNNTHEWCRRGVDPEIEKLQDIPQVSFRWWMGILKSGHSIHISDVSKLPSEANAEKEMLQSQNIKSLLVLPIHVKQRLIGFVGLDNVNDTGMWDSEDIALLKIFSEILSSAFERQKSEEALTYNVQRNEALLQAMPDIMFVINKQGIIVDYRTNTSDQFPVYNNQILGKKISKIGLENKVVSKIEENLEQIFKNHKMCRFEFDINLNHGKQFFEARLTLLNNDEVLVNVRNITSNKKFEEEMIKSAKLESLGVLAGGIAHDFNNLLTAFLGNISLSKIFATGMDNLIERLNAAENAALRARDLTRQLLTFSKGGEPIKDLISVSKLAYDVVKLSLSGSKVKCRFKISKDLWPIRADEGQISQVLHNLVINADQAMPNGGQIILSCENYVHSSAEKLTLEPGNYIKISIEDKGIGIPNENLTKIYDPYFTTKEKGCGLGLATAFSIVRRHQGYIQADSQVGKGSTFFVYLPAELEKTDVPYIKSKNMPSGAGKILLMDDEYMVREVAGEMLLSLGYQVDFAVDGNEALQKYKTHLYSHEPFDAVIMDLTIPGGMGGREAIQRLLELDAKAKVIVSSGYSNDPVMSDYKAYGFKDVISKPYQLEEFSSILKHVLESH